MGAGASVESMGAAELATSVAQLGPAYAPYTAAIEETQITGSLVASMSPDEPRRDPRRRE